MRSRRWSGLLLTATTIVGSLLGPMPTAHAAVFVIAGPTQDEGKTSTGWSEVAINSTALGAQEVAATFASQLAQVDLFLRRVGTPTTGLVMELRTLSPTDGTPDESVPALATEVIPGSSVPVDDPGWVSVPIDPAVPLDNQTSYAIVLTSQAVAGSDYRWVVKPQDPYLPGLFQTYDGQSWTSRLDTDATFRTFLAVDENTLIEHCDNLDNDLDSLVDEGFDMSDPDADGLVNDCPPNSDTDVDGDTTTDQMDNCRQTPNADQSDQDHDGVGDLCDSELAFRDDDVDGVRNGLDACPASPGTDATGCIPVATTVSLSYDKKAQHFTALLGDDSGVTELCTSSRTVTLLKLRRGLDQPVATETSDTNGSAIFSERKQGSGYHASVAQQSGVNGIYTCGSASSDTI